MPPTARILLLADTHLGFDLPFHPRVDKTRRGPDFFANTRAALQRAVDDRVDLVVHGGDLFYRSLIPPALVEMALELLVGVAQAGVPVFLVPGNHERSRIPLHLWTQHPNLHIFDQPRTFTVEIGGATLSLSGFPAIRHGARDLFRERVEETGYRQVAATARLRCLHETVEGAQVNDNNYTFRAGPEVIRGADLPAGFTAVLSGHIHRAQVLRRDLSGRPLSAPVIYPGAIERTAFAERLEPKGYVMVTVDVSEQGGRVTAHSFVPLPTRPMVPLTIAADATTPEELAAEVRRCLAGLDPRSVVRIRLTGPNVERAASWLTAARLRALAPADMDIAITPDPPALAGRRGMWRRPASAWPPSRSTR